MDRARYDQSAEANSMGVIQMTVERLLRDADAFRFWQIAPAMRADFLMTLDSAIECLQDSKRRLEQEWKKEEGRDARTK